MQRILQAAIKAHGSSMDDYRTPTGEKGRYQNYRHAYHRTKEKCDRNDGGVITRIVVGGRGTHFCPIHQKIRS